MEKFNKKDRVSSSHLRTMANEALIRFLASRKEYVPLGFAQSISYLLT